MDSKGGLELLHRYASTYQFAKFQELLSELETAYPPEALSDAYRMQAQIKLFSADRTLLRDLEKAQLSGSAPQLPCLGSQWLPDGPNRFVVFPKAAHALRRFLQILPQAGELLYQWYGEEGAGMARQVHSELLYFLGEFAEAARLAAEQRAWAQLHCTNAILSQYVLFRCFLATGDSENAEESMLGMIRLAKAYPECLPPYKIIRDWANLTTGWCGDTPRFYYVPSGDALPVLEDRMVAIQNGISNLSATEKPFATYAAKGYRGAYTMRQHYMDIFHALHWFHAGDHLQTEYCFLRAYRISLASGLVMPFVEYGTQVIPLLNHMLQGGADYSQDWISRILSLAKQYEDGLQAYRD